MSYIGTEVGKFCETVVNRKDSRTTKFTIYDLSWNGGQYISDIYLDSRLTFALFLYW